MLSLMFLLFLSLTGWGCKKEEEKVTPPANEQSLREPYSISPPLPEPGEVDIDIKSPNRQWRAYSVVAEDRSSAMTIEGPNNFRQVYSRAHPISFSPDTKTLVFCGATPNHIDAIFLLDLILLGASRQVTNKSPTFAAGKDFPPDLIPCPESSVSWVNSLIMRYTSIPGPVTYQLDLNTEEVRRVAP